MSIRIVDQAFDSTLWNKKAPHPLQSWEWGEARNKMGLQVVRVGEFSGTTLVNTFQLTIHKLPLGYTIGYLPRSLHPSSEVLRFFTDLGKKYKMIFLKMEPYEPPITYPISNIVTSPHPLFPEWTMTLDLTKSEDELLKKMKPKSRYNIRLAAKKGVTVKEMTNDEGFEIFQKLYFETAKRQNYLGHNYEYHKTIFDTLKGSIAHILVATYEDMPLGAYEVFVFNDRLYYTYGGSSDEHRNVMATHLLMWETIRFGKKHKAKVFDMWNSLPPEHDEAHPWAGFTRFKEGFGGTHLHLSPSLDLVINPLLYPVYNTVYKLRELLLGIKI